MIFFFCKLTVNFTRIYQALLQGVKRCFWWKVFHDKIDLENAGLDKILTALLKLGCHDLKKCPLSILTSPCSVSPNKPNLHFHNLNRHMWVSRLDSRTKYCICCVKYVWILPTHVNGSSKVCPLNSSWVN